MITKHCAKCQKPYNTYPSRTDSRYCSKDCYASERNHRLSKDGEQFRYQKGHRQTTEEKEKRRIGATGNNHASWKGKDVGYRGLHYWVRRQKGVPTRCVDCRTTERRLQWSNVDGKYARDADDYVARCASCHKIYDLNLATQDVRPATELYSEDCPQTS